MFKVLVFIFSIAISVNAYSVGLGRVVHIDKVFAEGATTAGFYTKESLPECLWGIMYISLANESGKAIFSIVLSAKAAGQTVVRIDYTKDAAGKCLAGGLHVQ